MDRFTTLRSVAAPLAKSNVDTEVIIPIARLIAFKRGALGPYAFEPWRYGADGSALADFPLNQARYRDAAILVTGENFGCGSSREAAVWALWDMGIRVIIAPSFGDIFRANAFQNGLLTITLEAAVVQRLFAELEASKPSIMTVDLEALQITTPMGARLAFDVDRERRQALLEGLDEIGLTLKHLGAIEHFEALDRGLRPWATHITKES